MQRWEYMVVEADFMRVQYTDTQILPLQDYLNLAGKEGWEVVIMASTTFYKDTDNWYLILKRPID